MKNKGLGLLAMAVVVCGITTVISTKAFAYPYNYCIDWYLSAQTGKQDAYSQCYVQCVAQQLNAGAFCDSYCAGLWLSDNTPIDQFATCMNQAATEAQMNYCDNVAVCVSACDSAYFLCMNAAQGDDGQNTCGDQWNSCKRTSCHQDTCQ